MKADPKRVIADHKFASSVQSAQHGQVFDAIVKFDEIRASWRQSFGFNLAAAFNPRMHEAVEQFSQIIRSGDSAEKKMQDVQRWQGVYGNVIDKFSLNLTTAFVAITGWELPRLVRAEQELNRAEEALEKALQAAA